MRKRVKEWNGKKYFLLGRDEYYNTLWLEEAVWECGWYWGFGYVESFDENDSDIASHEHFNNMTECKNGQACNMYDGFMARIKETPLSEREIWQLCELMQSFYIARKYSDMLHIGGAHYTDNPAKYTIKNEDEFIHINEEVIPEITAAVYMLLTV